nr:low temperature requirement protein A [Lentilactobacillus sp. SPB1-3]MCZ0977985.1 low temperature requirement protein A [Lentilactobacillus sp. SPB1-3]
MNRFQQWWGTPLKLVNRVVNRKISWLELFSDLAYVVMLHTLITSFLRAEHHYSVWYFILFFLLTFYIWTDFTLFFDLHGSHSARTTIITLIQMISVLAISTRFPLIFAGQLRSFIYIYIFVQVVMIYLWTLVLRIDPEHWESARLYLICAWLALFMLIGCLFFGHQAQITLLVLVTIIKYSVMLFNSPFMNNEMKRRKIEIEESEAIEERYGEFAMIVLGEATAIATEYLTGKSDLTHIVVFILVVLNVIGIWWIYYAFMDSIVLRPSHYIWVEILHSFHELLITVLALMALFLYEVLEDPSELTLILYILSLLASIVVIFCIKIYARREGKVSLMLAFIMGITVFIIGRYLSEISILTIINVFLALIIFIEERRQVLESQ